MQTESENTTNNEQQDDSFFEHERRRKIREDVHLIGDSPWAEYDQNSLLESAVVEACDNLQVSREMALTTALGAMAIACQGLIDIRQPTGNVVNGGLMLLTIAESGERKTTTEKQFFKGLRDVQNEKLEDASREQKDYQKKFHVWKLKLSALQSTLKAAMKEDAKSENESDPDTFIPQKDGTFELEERNNISIQKHEDNITKHLDKEPQQPKNNKFIYDDCTPQALVRSMSEGSKNACLVSSEANGIFNGKAFSELHLLNSLWDGGDVIVDRVSLTSFVLHNSRLTLALMTQMSVIEKFSKVKGEEARGMGFLARFLVVKAPTKAGSRDVNFPLTELKSLNKFNDRTRELINQSFDNEDNPDIKRTEITFNASSAQIWREYNQRIEDEMLEDGVYDYYRDHASKLMDNISRVAGVIQYFENGNTEITKETLKFSYDICMRYSKHFLTYLAGEPRAITLANMLAEDLIKIAIKERQEYISNYYKNEEERKRHSQNHIPTRENSSPKKHIEVECNIKKCRLPYFCYFNKSDITRSGKSKLREDNNFNIALKILTKMNFVKKIDDTEYFFCEFIEMINDRDINQPRKENKNRDDQKDYHLIIQENIQYHEVIKTPDRSLKNGAEYTLNALPLYEQMRIIAVRDTMREGIEERYIDVDDKTTNYKFYLIEIR